MVPGAIEAAAVATGTGFAVASRRKVVDIGSPDLNTGTVNWAIFPNGREFLYVDVGQLGAPRIVLVENWLELVRSKSAER